MAAGGGAGWQNGREISTDLLKNLWKRWVGDAIRFAL
jgi:hypothetical protein